MKKLSVIGLDTAKDEFISSLMDLGAVEVVDEAPSDETPAQPVQAENMEVARLDQKITDTEVAIEELKKFSPLKAPLFFTRRSVSKKDFQSTRSKESEYTECMNQVLSLKEQIHKLNEERNKVVSSLNAVTPWKDYDLPLNFTKTEHTHFTMGVIPNGLPVDELHEAVQEASATAYLQKINEDKEFLYLILVSLNDETKDVVDALKQKGFTVVTFPEFTENAEKTMAQLHNQSAAIEEKIHGIEQQIAARCGQQKDIEWLHDELVIQRDQLAMRDRLPMTKRTFRVTGWIPEECTDAAKKMLDAYSCYYRLDDPTEDDVVPVLLENNAFVTPFESVTEMYSLPDYHGLDATKWFSLFYACFFGMMLSDAGYGILLTVFTFVALRKYDLEGNMFKMMKLMNYCGISTIFWGAMFGGWFGNSVQAIASTFFHSDAAIKPIWFDPIQSPTKLLIFSLGLGIIHLFFGMGLDAMMKIKRGHFWDAVFDDFTWYMVIGGFVMLIGLKGTAAQVGKYLLIAGFVLIILTGGRDRKGIGKLIGGIGKAYNVTGLMSDIFSYARLLALGLATGVIAQVVNTIGTLGGSGIGSAIAMVIVFVIGHIFNLAINALGAYVHTSRLQYIEFFGKFYEDGGEPFHPFHKDTKYIKITE